MNKTKIYLISILICLFPSLCFGALTAGTVWEYQTTADANNGGGFYDRIPGTSVDYSQQTAAQLSLTDLAMVTGGTTLTSATGGFTAAMAGNIIYIASGTNFTAGFYEIIIRTDTNTVTIDRDATSGGLSGSSGVGKVGGALDLPVDADFEAFLTGDTVYIKAGTYTMTSSIAVAAGTAPIIIGYNTTRGDNPTDVTLARPIINLQAKIWTQGAYTINKFLVFTGSSSPVLGSNGGLISYCKITNTSIIAGRIGATTLRTILFCDLSSTLGTAINAAAACNFGYTWLHNSNIGFTSASNASFNNCIISACTTSGVVMGGTLSNSLINCIFYGAETPAGTGLTLGSTMKANIICNNIFYGWTLGATQTTAEVVTNVWDYNDFYNNTTDRTNVTAGVNDMAINPGFVDAANGNFQIGSALRAKGYPGTFPGNLTTGYMSPGAVQPDPSTGGTTVKRVLIF